MQTMINDNEKKNMFRYYVTQRPIDIGTIPNAKSAVNITRYEERKKLPGVDREVYGYVEYTTKLSKAEIESYELTEKILTDGNTLENKKEITINDVNIRSTHGEEKYVYVIRKNNGKYHIGWTKDLLKAIRAFPDIDKVLGAFIVPESSIANDFKKYLNKLSHFNIETMILYPENIKEHYDRADVVEPVNVTDLNDKLGLDMNNIIRKFEFMLSSEDRVNEIYNHILTNGAESLKEFLNTEVDEHTAKEYIAEKIQNRIPIIEEVVKDGWNETDILSLMSVDELNDDSMKYSLDQAKLFLRNGINTLVVDSTGRILPKKANVFCDLDITENTNIQYLKNGLHGAYYMEIFKGNGKADLYTVSQFSLTNESQLVLKDFNSDETEYIINKFENLNKEISDHDLAKHISNFLSRTVNSEIKSEEVEDMLKHRKLKEINVLLDNIPQSIETDVERNEVKFLVIQNMTINNRISVEQFITKAKEDKKEFYEIPEYIKEDIQGLRLITSKISGCLQYLPEIAQKDKECVLNCVKLDAKDYKFASNELKVDEEIVIAALKQDKSIIDDIPAAGREKIANKSVLQTQEISEISLEKGLALYAYIEDDISVQPVSRYFDVNRNNGSKKNVDAMYDEVAKVFNNADHILLRSGKTAVLKLKDFPGNEKYRVENFMQLVSDFAELPNMKNYEVVYIDNSYMESKEDIGKLFLKINGEERPKNFYADGLEMGDIIVTTKDGINFEAYYIDMENTVIAPEIIDTTYKNRINENLDVKKEIELLSRFHENNLLDSYYEKRLTELKKQYEEIIKEAENRDGDVKEEQNIELSVEEKNDLKKIEEQEIKQNILPKDRITYHKEDGEVILKMDAVKNKEELVERREKLQYKDDIIKNISYVYAIESTNDYPNMLSEYDADEIKNGINYRIVQIDKVSGKIVKINEKLFSSQEVAEEFFEKTIKEKNEKNYLASYDALIYKAFEVSSAKKDNELLKGITNVLDSENFKAWCTARANQFYKKYSLNNSLAIFMQNPNASIVFGARQWQDYGRQVKKGEKAIQITIPCKHAYQKYSGGLMKVIKKEIEDQIKEGKDYGIYRLGDSNLTFIGNKTGLYSMLINDQVILNNIDENSLSRYIDTKVIGKVPVAFTSANVFDISQVEEPEYLAIRNLKEEDKKDLMKDSNGNPLKTKSGAYKVKNTDERRKKINPILDMHIDDAKELNVDEVYKTLQNISEKNGIPVNEENIKSGANGYYHLKEKRIAIKKDLSTTHKVKTCIHEITHSRMHNNSENMPTRMKEVQAEAVAYIVNKSLGINTDNYSFNYIASWSGSRRMSEIKQSLDVINNEAAALYEEIRRDMDERGVQLKLEPIKNEDYEYAQSKILTSERKESYKKKIVDYTADYIEKNAQVEKEYDAITAKMKDVKDTYIAEQYINIQEAYTAIIRELEMTERFLQNIQGELDITNTNFDAIDTCMEKIKKCNERITIIENKIKILQEQLAEYAKSNLDKQLSKMEQFKLDFQNNGYKALQSIRNEYPLLQDISKSQMQYLSVSPHIEEQLMKIPNQSSMEVFVSLCMDQLENVESIKSEKGVFVEIVTSEYKDLKPGSVMHIKLADKQVNMIEKGMRKTKEEELKRGNLVPAVHVTINVYTETEKGNLLALSGLKLKLGNKQQKDLISAIQNRAEDYPKYEPFLKACQDSCKEMDVFKNKKTPRVVRIEDIMKQTTHQIELEKELNEKKQKKEKDIEQEDIELPKLLRAKSEIIDFKRRSVDINEKNEIKEQQEYSEIDR